MMAKKRYYAGGAIAALIVVSLLVYGSVIEAKKVQHLDSNRKFIEDITNQTNRLDGIFFTIPSGDYVRVEFKEKLTNKNDIMVYARGNGSIEIYEKGLKTKIATIENISNEGYYRTLLIYMKEGKRQSTFDMKIIGSVDIDYIVDPFMAGSALVTINSPVNNSNFNVGSVSFNVTGNSTLSWCGVSINGGANVTMTNTSSTVFGYINSSIADGSYNFIISCNDTAGTFGNSGLNYFLIDTIIPTLNVTSPLNSSTYNSLSVLFNVSSSEEGTGSIIPDIDNSLVSWWRMDDTNGSANSVTDYTGRNNGTAQGNAVQNTFGKLGKSYSFDGTGDYIGITRTADLEPLNLTISVWVRISNLGASYPYILSKARKTGTSSYAFYHNTATNTYAFFISNGTDMLAPTVAAATIEDYNWHHLVGTYDHSYVRFYVDGAQIGTGTHCINNILYVSTYNLTIGCFYENANCGKSDIDDVMFFNRSLSSDEILSLYNATKYQHTQTGLTDGSHNFKAYTQDLAGNVNNSGLIQFNVSTTVSDTCNMTDVIKSMWSYNAKFIDGFSDEFCTNVPVNSTFGEEAWSYSDGRFIAGISTTSSTLPYDLDILGCNMTDIAISIWCYPGAREINGIDTSPSPFVPGNATYGQYIWEWTQSGRYVNGIST